MFPFRCKGWKTYTLSYYDSLIREMVKLVTMEGTTEDHNYCEIFLHGINRMLNDYTNQSDKFNPINIQFDEHQSTKIAIKSVFGEEFLLTRTLGCDYHLNRSVEKHKKYVNSSDATLFGILINAMKNSVTEDGYYQEKTRLSNLISKQPESCRKPLTDMINFWDNVKYRWVTAFKFNTHQVSRSSLAEAAQASMKAGGEKNVSLVDAAYYDIGESARFEAKWQNRMNGESSVGRGPSSLTLADRNERRQVGRANQFVAETDDVSAELAAPVEITLSSSQPPKAKKRRLKSLESKVFQATLKKAKSMKRKICIVEMSKVDLEIKVKVRQSQTHRDINISKDEIQCDCTQQASASKKTCHHIVWVFLNLFKISENDQLLAQTEVGTVAFSRLANQMPECIPEDLTTINEGVREFCHQLKEHTNFSSPQVWYLSNKNQSRPSRCSGCLKPKKIMPGDIHFYVPGLLYLEKDDKVVETKLRFCLSKNCVTNITSSFHNIRPQSGDILYDPLLNELSQAERDMIKDRGFNIPMQSDS